MMKKISTILFVLLFASSFAQTKVPQHQTQTVQKPKAKTAKPTTKKVATTPTKPVTSAPQPAKPTPPPVQPAPSPKPTPQPTAQPVSQPTPQPTTQTQPAQVSKSHIEEVWLGGSIGGGLAVGTNIVGSGAVFPANLELLFQTRHHRCGIGFADELYITPESMYHLLLGEAPIVKKLYFSYEVFIFRNFPINLGFSTHVGFFGTNGNHTMSQKSTIADSSARGGMFGNIGCVLELGARPFYFFVRPSLEYKSWSGFHKELMATGSIGIRLKFLTDYEIKRRADKKRDRDNKY